MCLDNDTIVSSPERPIHDATQNTSVSTNQLPTVQLISYHCTSQNGRRTSLEHTFLDFSAMPCRYNKNSRNNATEKVKPRNDTAVTVIELNSHGPKDHTWCRNAIGPLSKALPNRIGSQEPETGT